MKQLLHKPFLIAILLISTSINSKQLFAQAGTLDLSFGDSGIVHATPKFTLTSIAVQSNNKIIASGYYYNGTDYITTSRFKPNGAIDSTYGVNGDTKTNFEGYNSNVKGYVATQANDRIVVAGYVEGTKRDHTIVLRSVVFRLLKNGTTDSSFGNNGGLIIRDSSGSCMFTNVLIQSNGKIVCAGYGTLSNNYSDFLLYRFNVNGTRDTTFGKNGICSIDFSHNDDFLSDCLLKPNGQFISIGGGYYDKPFEMAETGISGHVVKDFGTNGKVITVSKTTSPFKIGIQSSGRIILATADKNHGTLLLAYTSNGTIDSSFGINGMYGLPEVGINTLKFRVQDDDKIIGVGTLNDYMCVYRVLPNGNFDSSFADNGVFTLLTAPKAIADDVLILQNKKILVCGYQTQGYRGLMIRLNNDATHEPLAATATEQ